RREAERRAGTDARRGQRDRRVRLRGREPLLRPRVPGRTPARARLQGRARGDRALDDRLQERGGGADDRVEAGGTRELRPRRGARGVEALRRKIMRSTPSILASLLVSALTAGAGAPGLLAADNPPAGFTSLFNGRDF